MKHGCSGRDAKGYIELYKDGKFQKNKFFHQKTHRREIMETWRKEIRHLYGDFHFIIKLNDL